MELAARLFNKDQNSRRLLSDDALIRGVWPIAVGKVIARHTLSLKMVRTTLVVEMEDAVWRKQLYNLSQQIVSRLHKVMGNQEIESVEFRVGPPAQRREPGRESQLRPDALKAAVTGTTPDEADQILDPVLKKIYRLSRRRSTA